MCQVQKKQIWKYDATLYLPNCDERPQDNIKPRKMLIRRFWLPLCVSAPVNRFLDILASSRARAIRCKNTFAMARISASGAWYASRWFAGFTVNVGRWTNGMPIVIYSKSGKMPCSTQLDHKLLSPTEPLLLIDNDSDSERVLSSAAWMNKESVCNTSFSCRFQYSKEKINVTSDANCRMNGYSWSKDQVTVRSIPLR